MLPSLVRPAIASKAILLVFVLLCMVLAIEVIAVATRTYPHPLLLVDALPVPFFLWAIWSIRRAVVLVGQGAALNVLLSRMLERVGVALLLGGLASVFAVPIVRRLLSEAGSYLRYDAAAITLGVLGVGLMILSRVIADAEALRADLDEFV
jgi:hypothetical protein